MANNNKCCKCGVNLHDKQWAFAPVNLGTLAADAVAGKKFKKICANCDTK